MTLFQVSHDELTALLALRFTPWLGPLRIEALRRHFGSASAALSAGADGWQEVEALDSRSRRELAQPGPLARARQELEQVRAKDVRLLGRGLPGYPAALEALSDPPPVLWVKGELPELSVVPHAIGIVGTRVASAFALGFTRTLSLDLARAGIIVVSGLARGIDTVAHKAALEAGGETIGVLGSGVDRIYPGENTPLSRRMTVVSEHPLGTPPAAHHFPARNRIIAAMSAGSVIVEGSVTSGAMITAVAAVECGRSVFAVPGRPGDELSAGPHKLLREGAALCEGAQDVLSELGWSAAPPLPAPELPGEQAQVYAALHVPCLLDDLAARLQTPPAELQATLMLLRLQGLIEELPGGRYIRR